MPFLSMCELTNPSDLLDILPQLGSDLAFAKYSTLDEYSMNSFKVEELISPLGKYILDGFASRASSDLERQTGREGCKLQRNVELI